MMGKNYKKNTLNNAEKFAKIVERMTDRESKEVFVNEKYGSYKKI